MLINYLTIGSKKSQFLNEEYINTLRVFPYSNTQNVINNTAEKYYSLVDTSLYIDDYLNLYIRFIKPNMITSDDEFIFWQNLGYIPLTKKYFYKLDSYSNFIDNGTNKSIDITVEIYDLLYTQLLVKNFTSNLYIYTDSYLNELPLNTTKTITINFNKIEDYDITSETIDEVVNNLITKLNCILFDDSIFFESLRYSLSLEFFISKKIYSPITVRIGNLIFSEDDKIAKPYETTVSTLRNDTTAKISTAITNNILYKDIVYFLNLKGGRYTEYNFVKYNALFPINIKSNVSELEGGNIDNTYNNINYILNNYIITNFDEMNSAKLKKYFNKNSVDSSFLNYIEKNFNLNYSTLTEGLNVYLTLKVNDDDVKIKEFSFWDKETKYKNVMTSLYECDYDMFFANHIPYVTLENSMISGADNILPIDVSTVTFVPYSQCEYTSNLKYSTSKDKTMVTDSYGNYFRGLCKLKGDDFEYDIDNSRLLNILDAIYFTDAYYRPFIPYDGIESLIIQQSEWYGSANFTIVSTLCLSPITFTNIETSYRASSYYSNDVYAFMYSTKGSDNNYGGDLMFTSTSGNTGLASNMDEFTISFTMIPAIPTANPSHFILGDFFKIVNNEVYVFNKNIGIVTDIFKLNRDYLELDSSGNKKSLICKNIRIMYLITIRYNYGDLIIDLVELNPDENYEFKYERDRFIYANVDLTVDGINVSNFQVSTNGYNLPSAGYRVSLTENTIGFGYFDFKNRYVEDFLLYDFTNGIHKYGCGFITGYY